MRTSVTLDDNAYEIASHYAHANGITLSRALSELVRKATEPETLSPGLEKLPNGMTIFASRGKKITPELVQQILDEEYEDYK